MSNDLAVQLIDYTGAGSEDPARYAANVLVFTKQTRLRMDKDLMTEVRGWPEERIMEELEYMANTILSSLEFAEYKFLISNVTRAFTHQFVRTRTGSYAQQTMRVLDVDGWSYGTGPTIKDEPRPQAIYDDAMHYADLRYRMLIEAGAKIEDARGVLPTNIHTNIVAKFDLRTMTETARKRASSRTQGEYRAVLDLMIAEVERVHPWATIFFSRTSSVAAAELESSVLSIDSLTQLEKTNMVKLIDIMRQS